MAIVRLTMAQALVRYLTNQYVEIDGREEPFFGGVWAIFGHGNVAGIGEALHQSRNELPTYRAHNEQSMAHAAIAYSKALRRKRAMICTTSIGPGATNMITAAAVAHVNRLPVMFLPGDVFANRRPEPVLQQIEDFSDATVSANDCFRPVSRFFDRITRPEQILISLPRALTVLTDPAVCGPVTLALCQDVQAEACDYPESFFRRRVWPLRVYVPDRVVLDDLASRLKAAKRPLAVVGGGVHYGEACGALDSFVTTFGLPVAETQAGKGALAWDHAQNLGAIGVTGTAAANAAATEADLVIGIGTRLQDFTTGSRALFASPERRLVQINIGIFDAHKHAAIPVIGDARLVLEDLKRLLEGFSAAKDWRETNRRRKQQWHKIEDDLTRDAKLTPPTDAQVIGAVQRTATPNATIVCAAGGLPGELHRLWRAAGPGHYHVEYGYSCMGYEIAGGLGVKMAIPERDVIVVVGDGSYLMLNSEIATSVMLGIKLTIVLLDNGGFACINRLQNASGCASFNNLFKDAFPLNQSKIDFKKHAESLGAHAEKVATIDELETALARTRAANQTCVLVIETDAMVATEAGGFWWDVAVPEISSRDRIRAARQEYEKNAKRQRVDG